MKKLWMLRMKLNLTMLLRIMEMIGVDENDNKPEPDDADNVDDFNEDTCEVCLYDDNNVVHSAENNVEVQELFEDDRN